MDNKQTAVDDFLKGLDASESDPLKVENTDPFSSAVEEKEVKKEEEGEELPFHKNPKLKKYVDKEIAKALSNQQPKVVERIIEKEKEVSGKEDDIVTRLVGNDTPEKIQAAKEFRNYLSGLKEEAKQEVLNELQANTEQEKEAENEAISELEQGFENIEERYNVDLSSENPNSVKLRNEFIDFIRKVSPKNEDGEVTAYPDLEETFEVYRESRKLAPNNRAKELAARSMSRSTESVATAQQPADQSWNAVTKFIDKFRQ